MDINRYDAIRAQAQCLVSRDAMDAALDRMARAITADLGDRDPLILCIMTGAIIPAGLLLPRLPFPLQLDYLHVTRYRGATRGGTLHWKYRPSEAVRGRHVLLLDDILDEGLTLEAAVAACQEDGAARVHTAVLVEKEKPGRRPIRADYVGVRIPDRYVFGYGLDYREYFRNVPGIYAVVGEEA